jgi:hypothetical protein
MPNVTVVCHDSPTRDTCPTLYRTDDGECYVQGYDVTRPDILAQMTIPDGETVVRITAELVQLIAQAAMQGEHGALRIQALADPEPASVASP